MNIFLLILFGFLSGVVGGMGMGGGTVLVPLMSFLDVPQKVVQSVNLISFLPMCVVALGFHVKNGLVKPKHIGWIVLPASLCAVVGAFFAGKTNNRVLRICFGLFLVAVGLWQLYVAAKFIVKRKRRKTVVFSSVKCLKAKPVFLQRNTTRSVANSWIHVPLQAMADESSRK
ncbi:MAG: sulfite exporter TauE/SafE family protein [Corallococcus sp.]|nr:sulfite exporter TauE/SafE family protein [Corallococcus sp.]MCM1360041.1 sulfite exporter TauE/SafE family protein [Corallococcus sp.]MCM1395598.1 sulfite exporter TauE/SafE family protein [Corallococcus sp.]